MALENQNTNDNDNASPASSFQSLLQRHQNDAQALASKLFDENFQLRSDKRELKARLAEIQGKVPSDGAVVLTGEKAKAWQTYQELGKPEDLQASLEARGQVEGELKRLKREKQVASAAQAAGYRPEVLTRLVEMAGEELEFALEAVEVDGQQVERALVKQGEDAKPLQEFAAQMWPEFLPALAAAPESSSEQGAASQPHAAPQNTTQQNPAGTRLPAQTGGGKASKTTGVAAFIQRMNEKAASRPNPLARAASGE